MILDRFIFYEQRNLMDCGPTCIRMLAKHYGKNVGIEQLRKLSETTREGSSLQNIAKTAEFIGFRTLGVKIPIEKLKNEAPLPCVLHWNQNHFVVLYKVTKDHYYVADPGFGKLKLTYEEFLTGWGNGKGSFKKEGVALLVEPTPALKETKLEVDGKKSFGFLFSYLFRYKKFLIQLVIGLLVGSLLQLVFPFLTQSIVDIGIQNRDVHFIYLILFAQLLLFAGRTSVELIRGWILLHLSTRINISLISDFFMKLMRLPISYFDTKLTGDLMQRIDDHKKVEDLLTTTSLNVLFSIFNLLIFGAVLGYYNLSIFFVFLVGSTLHIVWVGIFLKKRKELDYKKFSQLSTEQGKVIELINGMQEIKLHNAEREKRWGWELLQAKLFRIETKNLALQQTQRIGASIINEFKNIVIVFLAATLVVEGQISLGIMMAITFIIGQLNSPVQQLIGIIFAVQDAKIALERLSEIHGKEDEEPNPEMKINDISTDQEIELKEVEFRYPGTSKNVIEDLTLTIHPKKTTAIVGASGSGKTTLMKMLLKFYEPQVGEIKLGSQNLNNISQQSWREKCGVVMQEGYIFNDTIAENIAVGQDYIDQDKLNKAVEIANIKDFIDSLPLGFNTKIGMEGVGMSTGQKQRLLIARAVYKNPEIICFDEATSALDAKNERVIMENLNAFFKERTAIVIAHRLSTVKNADQIVVLDEGKIIEKGTHQELVDLKGNYYNLVKNQLELEKLNA
jgi:ATP-binding cassette subfamily B protein